MHPLGPERVDRDRQRERRIHAAGQTHDHAGKTMLGDVVAHPEHQRAIDALLVRQFGRDRARSGTSCAPRRSNSTQYSPSLKLSARITVLACASIANELPSNTSSSWPPSRFT
jgi:hypothetical protein